ncbi:Chromosome partition protein Smc [Streptomyces sp. YIM 121038]|uniref:phage tail tape measure protein n=1 Tax=Streptomyces sp. YIM 121038 TaxID=2136401 RepID=UPI0011104EEF|nr:phage tail tape measure protein [Streptomyces sp. YIM 121038]QCX75478.1 Chromosome partition protein Smc [Streptomyces sp. YIM 121038]
MAGFTATARIDIDVSNFARASATVGQGSASAASGVKTLDQAVKDLQRTLSASTSAERAFIRSMAQLAQSARQLDAPMRSGAASLRSMVQAMRQAGAPSRQIQQTLAGMRTSAQQAAQGLNQAGAGATRFRTQTQGSAASASALVNSLRQVGAAGSSSTSGLRTTSASIDSITEAYSRASSVFHAFSGALAASVAEVTSAAISHEAAFAQVERVTQTAGGVAKGLKTELEGIALSTPLSFKEVASIAQLAAQTGIAKDEVAAFSKETADFSVVTGIAADQATLLSSRILMMENIPVAALKNFNSAVLALGTASAATEEEILRVNQEIAASAKSFGLSATAAAGLSSTLASLKISPYLARGSLARVLNNIRTSAEGGGEGLRTLADIMGVTASEAQSLIKSNPDKFFMQFVRGLGNIEKNGGSAQQALRSLGLTGVQDTRVFVSLAQNADALAASLNLSKDAWLKGNEVANQSGVIYETTAAKLENLKSAWEVLLSRMGEAGAGGLGAAAEALTGFLEAASRAQTVLKYLGPALAIGGGVIAAWAAFRAALLGANVAASALVRSQQRLQGQALTVGTTWSNVRGALSGVTAATTRAQAAQQRLAATQQRLRGQVQSGAMSWTQYSQQIRAAQTNVATTAAALTRAQRSARLFGNAMRIVGGTIATFAIFGIIEALQDTRSTFEKVSDAALEAAGGVKAFQDAMQKDAGSDKMTNVLKQRLKVLQSTREELAKTQEGSILGIIPNDSDGPFQGSAGVERAKRLKDTYDQIKDSLGDKKGGVAAASKIANAEISKLNEKIRWQVAARDGRGIQSDYEKRLRGDLDAMKSFRGAIDNISESENSAKAVLEGTTSALDKQAKKAKGFQQSLNLSADAADELAENVSAYAEKFSEGFKSFDTTPLEAWTNAVKKAGGESKTSLDDWISSFNKSLSAVRNWSTNLTRLASQLPQDVVAELAGMGVQGAGLVEKLVGADPETRKKIIASVRLNTDSVAQAYSQGMVKLGAVLGTQGQAVSKVLSDNLSSALLDTAAKNPGAIEKTITGIASAFKTLSALKIKPQILFDRVKTAADLQAVLSIVRTMASAQKAKVDIDINDAPAKLSLKELEAWVKAQEVSGLLDAKGKAVMNDAGFRKKVVSLAQLVLGKKATGEFDVDGKAGFSDAEFRALFKALMDYIAGNKSKFNVTGTASLTDNATPKLNGIIQAMNSFNGRTATAYANTVQTTYRRQIDQGNRGSVQAASGGYISGPGGPRDDRIHAMLSNGEYVVNADSTRRHRALLDKINARGRRASTVQPFHYANGGQVQAPARSQHALNERALARAFESGGNGLVRQLNRLADRKVDQGRIRTGPVITVNNQYPRSEPTSTTINRSLAYAAALNGTL